MMQYYPIPDPLKPYVESIWSFESPDRLDYCEQAAVIPTGRWILIWNYQGQYEHIIQNTSYHHPLYDLHLVGQHNSKIELKGTEPVHSIGISFKPYGYYAIEGKELPLLVNKVQSVSKRNLDGKELLASFTGNLHEAVAEITGLIIERIRYTPDQRVVEIINQINACNGNILIKELFGHIPGSQRHLNKLFKAQVGITPKEYVSIIRFHEIYNRYIRNEERENKSELYDFFYDESHFIMNFRKILLTKPHQFMKKVNKLGNQFIRK